MITFFKCFRSYESGAKIPQTLNGTVKIAELWYLGDSRFSWLTAAKINSYALTILCKAVHLTSFCIPICITSFVSISLSSLTNFFTISPCFVLAPPCLYLYSSLPPRPPLLCSCFSPLSLWVPPSCLLSLPYLISYPLATFFVTCPSPFSPIASSIPPIHLPHSLIHSVPRKHRGSSFRVVGLHTHTSRYSGHVVSLLQALYYRYIQRVIFGLARKMCFTSIITIRPKDNRAISTSTLNFTL